MAMTLYEHWHATPPASFRQGVELLLQHCPDRVTKSILIQLQSAAFGGKAPDGYLKGKLCAALQNTEYLGPVREELQAGPAGTVTITTGTHLETEGVVLTTMPAPPAGVLTSELAKQLHKEQAHHHALMQAADTDEDRARHAREIMWRIIPALDAEYDRLRSGNLATSAAAPAQDATPTLRRLQSLRTRIARISNQLLPACTDTDRRVQLEAELKEKRAQAEAIQELLK